MWGGRFQVVNAEPGRGIAFIGQESFSSLGNPDPPSELPRTRLDDFPADIVVSTRTRETASQPMRNIIATATPDEVKVAGVIDLLFSRSPNFNCPSSNFTCPRLPMSRSEASFFMLAAGAWTTPAGFLGLDASRTIGELRPQIINAMRLFRVLSSYPFPRPIPLMPGLWVQINQTFLQAIVAEPVELRELFIEMSVTAATLDSYVVVSGHIKKELKEEAKQQRRNVIMQAVVQGVVLIGTGYGIGVALAPLLPATGIVTSQQVSSAITTAMSQLIAADDRKRMARNVERVAGLFRNSDPAFAELVSELAETLDFLAAEGERLAEARQEDLDAIADVGTASGTPELLVGGGIVAVVIAALALG